MKNPEDQAFNLRDGGCDEKRIYLDHNATTPLASELVPHINQWLSYWGNPSSIHWSGRGPKALIREARQSFASMIGCRPPELVFTAGGSESNNMALRGCFKEVLAKTGRKTLIVSQVEHPSVAETVKDLESEGAVVKWIPVSRGGELDLEFLQQNLNQDVAMVSVMAVNNEVGMVFPVAEIAKMAHAVGAYMHTDAVQALGKMSFDIKKWDVDLASFSGHKFYSLKGCGVLYIKKGTPVRSHITGGGQERHRRAGTENALAIASLGYMTKYKNRVSEEYERLAELRSWVEEEIQKRISKVIVNADKVLRVPNTSSLIIEGTDGESLLMNLDIEGVSVSTGAACSSGNPEPSPALLAMGLKRSEAQSSLRIGMGWATTKEDLEVFISKLEVIVKRLREANSFVVQENCL